MLIRALGVAVHVVVVLLIKDGNHEAFPRSVKAIFLQCTVCKNAKFTLTSKKFVKSQSVIQSVIKTLISRNFCKKIKW